jgi:hypothetical protein
MAATLSRPQRLPRLGQQPAAEKRGVASSAARLRVTDPTHAHSLVRFFRSRDYLAVQRARDVVEVVPLIALSESADRRRLIRLVDEWRRDNPNAAIDPLRTA